jgi:hypothetical protein
MKKFEVTFLDAGREPECPPDPKYPDGMDIVLSKEHDKRACKFELPYPAPRCGAYMIVCNDCKYAAVITVAGRVDDPKTIQFPCKLN